MKILTTLFGICLLMSSLHAEVPYSLTRLSKIQDKESEAYIFLAHQAAMDARLAAQAQLEGENSSGALKTLTLALGLMPHRNDLKDLRNKALGTYIGITKKLEEDVIKNCDVLKDRYHFLYRLAPDSIAGLKYDQRCVRSAQVENSFSIPEPRQLKSLESEFKADLTHTTIHFPFEDVLNNTFMLFTSLFGENFKVSCLPKNISGQKVSVACSSTKKNEASYKEFSLKYCKFLNELLMVPQGTRPVKCTIDGLNNIFRTSDSLYNTYVTAVEGPSFDDDIPVIVSMNMAIHQKERQHSVPVLVRLNQKNFKASLFPLAQFEKSPAPYFFETLGPMTEIELAPDDIKDLTEISFTINLKKTYEAYKAHYQSSILQDLSCQDMNDELKTLSPSRKKRELQKKFNDNCPEKGNLEHRLLNE